MAPIGLSAHEEARGEVIKHGFRNALFTLQLPAHTAFQFVPNWIQLIGRAAQGQLVPVEVQTELWHFMTKVRRLETFYY